jgi:hypothetical protein
MAERPALLTALIILPVAYNPDAQGTKRPVEDEKFMKTAEEEIARKFGGGTIHRYPGGNVEGFWWDKGILFAEVHAVLEVDVPDTSSSRTWLRSYARNVLLRRSEQRAMYIRLVGPIEQIIVDEEQVNE